MWILIGAGAVLAIILCAFAYALCTIGRQSEEGAKRMRKEAGIR